MKVKVELYASLRERAGFKEAEYDLPSDATVADLLEALRARLGLSLREVEACKVLIDGKDVEALGGRSAPLREGCRVSIFPPIAGG